MQHERGKDEACGLLMGKPKRNRSLGRPRHKGVDNIKMYLGEIGWDRGY
jgi:hypothetical protein